MDFKPNFKSIMSKGFIIDQGNNNNKTEPYYYYYLQIQEIFNFPQLAQYQWFKLLGLILSTIFAILPKGTVRDEGTFFILISILAGLIVTAYIMRVRRNRQAQ